MTQEQLAGRAGVALATIRSLEAGRTQNPYKIRDVQRALGLLDDSEERRIRDLLVANRIDPKVAADAARIITSAADHPIPPAPQPPPMSQPGNDAARTA